MTQKRALNAHMSSTLLLVFVALFAQVGGQHLYGIAYSPYRRYGHCPTRRELSQDNVIARTHTQRIRLYSTECHHLNNVYLKAASMNRQGANFEVLLGVWIDRNAAKNAKEIQDLYVFLRRYPFARLSGIAVGNEVLYRKEMHPAVLAQKVAEVKAAVRQIASETGSSILQRVPVFSVDAIPHPKVVAVSDAVGVNVHPFYGREIGRTPDSNAMSDLALRSAMQHIALFQNSYPGKEVFVTETGWPSSSAPHEIHRGDLQVSKLYMQKFSAWAATTNVKYWWFQLFDAPWKKHQYPHEPESMSEFHWGMYDKDRRRK